MIRSSMALWSVYVPVSVLAAVVYLGQHSTTAHSWIDCFDTNRTKIYDESASYIYGGSGGNGFCEGYGAGYPGRGDTDIGTGYTFKMLENEVEAGTAVCETVDADTYTNTDWRKRVSVAPGVTVYYAYLPNGHIVKDKKAIGTQHGVYWTGEAGSSLTSTLEMTQENLMDGYTLNFDDGNCGETYDYNGNPGGRAGDGKPCIGSFVVPTGTAPGIYSMVWYWTFWLDNEASYVDQSQARGYFGAAYSTCFEVEVTSGSGSSVTTTESPSTTAPEVTTATPQATTAPQSTTATPEATIATPTTTIPATETPLPMAAPEATTETPASTANAPITSWDQVDSNTAAGDAGITNTPISTTSTPQVTTPIPMSTTAPPTSAPVLTTAAPIETPVPTETPIPTTASPVEPTEAPIAATNAPVVETSAPVTETPQATTSAPVAVTEAPEQITVAPTTTTVIPTETTEMPEVATGSSGSDSGHSSSLDTTTFSSLNSDEGSVGTVRPASTSSSASTSKSSSSDSTVGWEVGSSSSCSSTSDSSTGLEVGSDSYDVEPQRSGDSASTTDSPTQTSAASSSSTTSTSANAETSFAAKTSKIDPWLSLAIAIVATAASF